MVEFECCKTSLQRVYYFVIVAILTVILFLQIITLGIFGVQFSRTRSFWTEHVNPSATEVCVLYGRDDSRDSLSRNPMLSNNASCGFILWGLATSIFVALVWIASQVIMGLLGRPRM